MNRNEKYHAQYAPLRRASNVIAVTPAAMKIEQRAMSGNQCTAPAVDLLPGCAVPVARTEAA